MILNIELNGFNLNNWFIHHTCTNLV